jgi:plastocyanin
MTAATIERSMIVRLISRLLVVVITAGSILVPATSLADTKRFRAAGGPGSFRWEPSVRRIVRRDRIVWTNPTGASHTVTAYRGRWSKNTLISPGERTARRFRRAGLYKFRCTINAGTPAAHSTLQDGRCSGMCGRVRVRRA